MNNTILTKTIFYAGAEYCVIPYNIEGVYLCITGNAIIGISLEEEYSLYTKETKPKIVIQAREAFTTKTMNRKLTDLDSEEKNFFSEVFTIGNEINKIIINNIEFERKREELLALIENGLIGRKICIEQLNQRLSSLIQEKCTVTDNNININQKSVTVFDYCLNVLQSLTKEKKMGLFDTFLNDNGQSEKVLNYIKNLSHFEVIDIIKNEYFKIKGTTNLVPQMGEYGSFEFAGALLLWNYIKADNNLCFKREWLTSMSILGDTIACAYNGMPAGEWSDRMDDVINASNYILLYSEWSSIYNYLKKNFWDEIHKMEFNKGTYSEQKKQQIYERFIIAYNSSPDFFATMKMYEQLGLCIKQQIPVNMG